MYLLYIYIGIMFSFGNKISTFCFLRKMVSFGEPWPEFNAGICYRDLVRLSDAGNLPPPPKNSYFYIYIRVCMHTCIYGCVCVSTVFGVSRFLGATVIEFYTTKYKNSAPLHG